MTTFLVPDYYEEFHCKMSACRHSCCRGWRISICRAEYEALCSLSASNTLQALLNGTLECTEGANAEHYARFVLREDGSCPLLRGDGLCALQAECGEALLPGVCRLFPRIVRSDGENELALSSSCEAVTELLFSTTQPLRLVRRELSMPASQAQAAPQVLALMQRLHDACIGILQNRNHSISLRIAHLLSSLDELSSYERLGDAQGLSEAVASLEKRAFPEPQMPGVDWLHIAMPLALAGALFPTSASLSGYWPAITSALGLPAAREAWTEEHFSLAAQRYAQQKQCFEQNHPDWQEHWERLMVNYALYTHFPFSERLSDMRDEARVLCACYALTRFAAVTCTAEQTTPEPLIDVITCTMRLIEHSGFDRRCAAYLRDSSLGDTDLMQSALLTV